MKVQITVDEQLWRRSRVASFGMGKTLGGFVELALKDLLHVVEKAGVESEPPKQPKVKSGDENRRVGIASVVGPANEDLVDKLCPLKEGYGWCLACKVEQVKLPSVLCPACKKG